MNAPVQPAVRLRHPTGLTVLFLTEMWERFSFYSMVAMFTLYMQDDKEGFAWARADATRLYSNYLMWVYASPFVGGLLADLGLGYRRSVMIGAVFFMAGHLLLAFRDLTAVYGALACLVIGNGFFKPNVSAMVGNLYPEGSPLKERAYNIFYLGINLGAFSAPIVAEFVKRAFGFHVAFTVAAFGMVVSLAILASFRRHVEDPDGPKKTALPGGGSSSSAMEAVPEWKRITALLVVFTVVIVFWMAFKQNGSTLTYWANDNTAWEVSGIISNSINAFWVITLTFPLIWFWNRLARLGLEPSTPGKIAAGMFLTAASFSVLYLAARTGESAPVTAEQYAAGDYRISDWTLERLKAEGVPESVVTRLDARDENGKFVIKGAKFAYERDTRVAFDADTPGREKLTAALEKLLSKEEIAQYGRQIEKYSYLYKVSPLWLIMAYMVVTLGELMLSPMGLALVAKVAPFRLRGVMMGGWFVATAIGNKLTMIGVFWDEWLHSTFFALLSVMALATAFLLLVLLRPLKKAMPGV
jgi:proton-dependent oligopeptide transporter, POT family